MSEAGSPPSARADVEALAPYRPGRSVEQAIEEHGIAAAVKLASNELPFDPLPSVAKALGAALGELNRYPDHRATRLREQLALHHQTSPDRIAVGCGSVGLLQQLCVAYVEPGDGVVLADPSFEAYAIFARLVGGDSRPVPLRRLTYDRRGLVAATDEGTRLVLVAQPNNPTGTAMSGADLGALADAVPASCLLVVDEAYFEFATGRHLLDATVLLNDHPNVVVLRTFSKAHGLAGLRIGYALAHPSVIAAIDKVQIPFSVSRLAEVGALASLDAPAELDDRVQAVLAERDRLCRALRAAGWSVPDTQANFVFLPAGEMAVDLAVALERAGFITRPFPSVGVRVTVGLNDDTERFAETFLRLAEGDLAERLHASWGLPTGVEGRAVASWLDRLDACEERLGRLAESRRAGLTEPDPGGEERWDDGQVWAHLAEFGPYWIDELEAVLDRESDNPVAFGRTKTDPGRIAAIAANRRQPPTDELPQVEAAIDRLRAVLSEMSSLDWARQGEHPTLGRMDVDMILDEFLVGHYEQHAAQLDGLGG